MIGVSLLLNLGLYISILSFIDIVNSLPYNSSRILSPVDVHCTPGTCQCNLTKRSLPERDHTHASHNDRYVSDVPLTKRIITPDNQGLTPNQFMIKYAALRPPPGPPQIKNFGFYGRGWQSTYASLKNSNQAFGITLSSLIGCTAVAIVSDTAVWMGHLWEGMEGVTDVFYSEFRSAVPEKEVRLDDGIQNPEFTNQQLQTTEEYIRDFLEARRPKFQVNLKSKRSEFNTASGRVYIMTPMQPFTNLAGRFPFKYQHQVDALQEIIEETTGIDKTKTTIVGYNVLELLLQREYQIDSARGRMLYLYDPNVPKKHSLWLEGTEMKGLPEPI